MREPRVTVITPTYNRPRHLRNVIDNVLAQTFTDWEHLICCDGPDRRVKRLVKRVDDRRIKYLHTDKRYADVGHSPANHALKYATGDLIVRVDDDNEIYPTYLEEMVAGFINDEVGYVVCWIEFRDSINPRYRTILKPDYPFKRTRVDGLNFIIRTDLARQVGGWQPGDTGGKWDVYAADFYLIDRVSRIAKGHFVAEILGCHRAAPGSVRRFYAREARCALRRWVVTLIPAPVARAIRRVIQ